jgi:lipoyl(octanoyl) transferase
MGINYKKCGLINYKQAWDLQHKLFNNKKREKEQGKDPGNDYFLLCQHPHVITIGKSGKLDNLLVNEQLLAAKNVELFRIDRGGDITYHGPGQIVGYPIVDIEKREISVKQYVYLLEQTIINVLSEYDLIASRLEGATGVWIDTDRKPRKICAIGVKVSRYITMHGFAFNVNTDLEYFRLINPCGFTDKSVTSLQMETNMTHDIQLLEKQIINQFHKLFNY